MNVTIDVTQADIDAGCEIRSLMLNDGGNCPVWRAASRMLPGAWDLWVTATEITEKGPDGPLIADLPPQAIEFIDHFDTGDPVEPFSFQVDVPDRWLTAPAVTS